MNSKLLREIKEIKKQISLFEDYVRVQDSGLSYISTDNDETKTDKINRALLVDLNNAAKNAGVSPVITTASSGHSERTISGTRSRHPDNNAVDIAIINGESADGATSSKEGNPKFKELGDKLKDALVRLGYEWNKSESGNHKVVLWQTNQGGNHYNHLHVSNTTEDASDESSDDETTSSSGDYKQPKAKTDVGKIIQVFQKFIK
jgi:hypothetical protein